MRTRQRQLKITPELLSRLTGFLLVMAAMLLWSTVPVGTRWLVRDGGTFSAAFIATSRLVIAAMVFLLLRLWHARRTGQPVLVPTGRTGWLLIAAAGLAGNLLLYGIGLRYTTAGATALISPVNAVATVLLAAWLLGERLTRQKFAGMALAGIGVILTVLQGTSLHELLADVHFQGNLIEIAAALCWPLYAIGQSKLLHATANRDILVPIFMLAAVLSLCMLPFTGPIIIHPPALIDWAIIAFLGAGSTAAAYWLFAAGLQRIETSEGAMFNVIMPPLALLLAHWQLHEPLHAQLLFGLAFVIVGLVLIVWRRSHSAVARRHPIR